MKFPQISKLDRQTKTGHIHLQLYTTFNTKRFELSAANEENQEQAPKQILVFNHRAVTKASGLITEQ